MNMILEESRKNNKIKCLPEGTDMGESFDDGKLELIYNYSDGVKKTEHLNNMSWELYQHSKNTTLRFLYYRNVNMYLGYGPIPGHPRLYEIAFYDVTFLDQDTIYLERCTSMSFIYFLNCTGVLRLERVELEVIILGSESDRKCFQLSEAATAKRVALISDVSEGADHRGYLEGHFIRALKRVDDRKREARDEDGLKVFIAALKVAREKHNEVKRLYERLQLEKEARKSADTQLSAKDAEIARLADSAKHANDMKQEAAEKQNELAAKAEEADSLAAEVQRLSREHNDICVYLRYIQYNLYQQQLGLHGKDAYIQQLEVEKQYNFIKYHTFTIQIGQMNAYIHQLDVKIKAATSTQSAVQLQQVLQYNQAMMMKMQYDHANSIDAIQLSIGKAKDAQANLQAVFKKMLIEKKNWTICQKCGYNFHSEADLNAHSWQCVAKLLTCYYCSMVFTNEVERETHSTTHIARYNNYNAGFECYTCGTMYYNQILLYQHITIHSSTGK